MFVKGDPDIDFQWSLGRLTSPRALGIDKIGLMTAKMEAGQ